MDNTYEESILAAAEGSPSPTASPLPKPGPILVNLGIRYGIMSGLFLVAWQLMLYMIDWELTAGFWSYVSFAVWIGFLYFLAIEARKSLGGFISFQQVLAVVLVAVIVSGLLTVLYTYVLNTFVDPELPRKLKEYVIENMEKNFTAMGMDEDEIAKQIKGQEAQDMSPSLKNLSIYLAVWVVFGLILGLFIGLIAQRKKPLFPDAR